MVLPVKHLSNQQKELARRFAAYRVYCDEQEADVIDAHQTVHKPGVTGARLAMAPFEGYLIVMAMHEAMCAHQHPLPFEFERAAALFNIARNVGYFGKRTAPLTSREFAEYLLANEDVFADMAAQAVENMVRLSIRNDEMYEANRRISAEEFVARIRRAQEVEHWLYQESDKWIRRDGGARVAAPQQETANAT